MRIRRNPFPHRIVEILSFLVIGGLVPIVFLYNIIVVLPTFHATDTFLYKFSLFIEFFLLLNLESNTLACMLIDTSVDQHVKVPTGDAERLEWHHCKPCNRLVPPRTWHCKLCDVCILKRDHHCGFTGYCVGHLNHRYFLCFLLYLFALTAYNFVYNALYMFKTTDVLSTFLAFSKPSHVYTLLQIPQIACGTVYVGVFFSCFLFVINMRTAWRGKTSFECEEHAKKYNYGAYNNLKSVFGQRMHLAWICPFIKSELPGDGYSWMCNPTEDAKQENLDKQPNDDD